MRLRLSAVPLLALGLAASSALPVAAQEIHMIAFGDSVTDGYGDTSNPGGGYPPRLQRWLRQRGHDVTVSSHGVGGETTSSGLSRIDSVLADGGDYLLLMEGTNDISQRVGIESIRFNLDEMAGRAEALGMVAVHASVIPRIPTAPVDSGNAATSALALAIRTMGEETHRAVADQFTLFEGLPDVFVNYYFYDEEVLDPVGHPNTDGYIEIGGLFLETLLPLLETPTIEIVPPPGQVQAGTLAAFGIEGSGVGQFIRIEWDFGDGGYAQTVPPEDPNLFYVFLHPGTYTVTVRGYSASGAVSEDSANVVVSGGEPAWVTAATLLPVVVESADGLLVSDLVLANTSVDFAVAEVVFLPEIAFDSPPSPRRFLLSPQSTLRIDEVLPEAFGIGAGRGALEVAMHAFPGGSTTGLTARASVHTSSDPDGSDGATVTGIPSASWSASAKQILNIPFGPAADSTLVVANLDGTRGTVRFDLSDALGAYVGSGVLELGANGARLRSIADLFRNLDQRPAPFKATFAGAAIRFTAATLVTDPTGDDVRVLTGTP